MIKAQTSYGGNNTSASKTKSISDMTSSLRDGFNILNKVKSITNGENGGERIMNAISAIMSLKGGN